MKISCSRRRIVGAVAIFAFISLTKGYAITPTFPWAQRAGGAGREYATGVAIDTAGRSHVIGRLESTNAVFGSHTLTNSGLFVTVYDRDGEAVWAKQIGITFNADPFDLPRAYNVEADSAGNTYICGSINGPGQITFDGVTLTNPVGNEADLFLAKYSVSGNLIWARKAGADGSTNFVRALAFASSTDGECYVTGDYVNAPSMGLTNAPNPPAINSFTAKFDTDGNLVWARTMMAGKMGPPYRAIALDGLGGYFVSGQFYGASLTVGGVTLTNAGNSDVFIVHYDSSGNLLWAKRSGSAGQNQLLGLGADTVGNCYLNFYASSTASIDSCIVMNGENCLAKFGPNGDVLWCRNTSTNVDLSRFAVDGSGNSYVFGNVFDVVSFDGFTLTNPGSATYPNFAYPLNFLVKFDPDGRVLWAKQFGGGENEYDFTTKGGIAVDSAGNCSIAGFIRTTNALFDTFTLSPASDDEDVYVAFLEAEPPRVEIASQTNSLVLSWPTNPPGFKLESATALDQPDGWSPITNIATTEGIRNFVTNPITGDSRFFRLRKQ